jgi:hypothetical protein
MSEFTTANFFIEYAKSLVVTPMEITLIKEGNSRIEISQQQTGNSKLQQQKLRKWAILIFFAAKGQSRQRTIRARQPYFGFVI